MKNSTFKKLLSAVIFVALSCNVSMAIEYCHYPVTTTPGTFYLTCKTTGTNQYELILETDVPMLSVGNNIYLRIDGGTATNLGQFAVFSPDRKTVTMAFTSTALPYDMHGQIGIEFQTGNNWGYANWPPNVDWTATCGGGEDDET